jgi:hypothetical protein
MAEKVIEYMVSNYSLDDSLKDAKRLFDQAGSALKKNYERFGPASKEDVSNVAIAYLQTIEDLSEKVNILSKRTAALCPKRHAPMVDISKLLTQTIRYKKA